jgi:hypothetical protein
MAKKPSQLGLFGGSKKPDKPQKPRPSRVQVVGHTRRYPKAKK